MSMARKFEACFFVASLGLDIGGINFLLEAFGVGEQALQVPRIVFLEIFRMLPEEIVGGIVAVGAPSQVVEVAGIEAEDLEPVFLRIGDGSLALRAAVELVSRAPRD